MDNKARIEAICVTYGVEKVESHLQKSPPHFNGNDRKYAEAWVTLEKQRIDDAEKQDTKDSQALTVAKQANIISVAAALVSAIGILIALLALYKS